MKALLVAASPDVPSPELVAGLFAEADITVAVDGGIVPLAAAGMMPDLFVGDVDSAAQSLVDRLARTGVEVVTYPAMKDASDLRLALGECERRGCDELVVLGARGGRLDHELTALGAIADFGHLRPVIMGSGEYIVVLDDQGRTETVVCGKGVTFSVIALRAGAVVTVHGAQWPLQDRPLDPLSDLGLSNVVVDDTAHVRLSAGAALVIAFTAPNDLCAP